MFTHLELENIFEEVFLEEDNFISNAANFAAIVYHNFENINWAGFYLVKNAELVLAPFQGKIACVRIKIGKGVCGTAAELREAVKVDDVHIFPGHIACDADSKSELVIPIIHEGILYGVLDIDSPVYERFTDDDLELFKNYLQKLIDASDMVGLLKYYSIETE